MVSNSKKKQYDLDSQKIAELLGENNIISASHCQTRLRLVLRDPTIVDIKEIDKLDSVKGTFTQSGQFQIIIGTDVGDFYKYFLKYAKITQATKEETKIAAKKQANKFQKAMSVFSEIFIPLIPVIVAGGLILAFRNLLELEWSGAGSSAINNSTFAKNLDDWLWLPAQAVFWYLPVHVCWSMFQRANKPGALGITIGIMLIAPGTLVNMYSVSDALGNIYVQSFYYDQGYNIYLNIDQIPPGTEYYMIEGGVYSVDQIIAFNTIHPLFDFTNIDPNDPDKEVIVNALNDAGLVSSYEVKTIFQAIDALDASYFTSYWPLAISYIGQIIPALLVGWFAVWFYGLIERHTIPSVRYVWPPFITILITQIIALGLIGPIGAIIGWAISVSFEWAFTQPVAKYFFGPLFGLLYPVLVITGLHQTLNAVMLQLTTTNANFIFPMLALSNMAQGAAVFAVVWMLKKDAKMREQGNAAAITCWLGVTEPAMYGVNLRFMFPFVAAMIGSAIASTFDVAFGITANGIGMGGILGFLNVNNSSLNAEWAAWPIYILIMIGTVIWTFFLTILFSKKSHLFAKLSTEGWNDYQKNVEENLQKNIINIEKYKYRNLFENEKQKYHKEFEKLLDNISILKITQYEIKDNLKHLKKDKNKKEIIKEKAKITQNKKMIIKERKKIDHIKKLQEKENKINKKSAKKNK
ncbi:MAG: hypothetical protein HPPSJP_2470 [Candidatus Hepatoplasma scabrum]|nr:MAG: hypothetical protein HPPSJP_2470 [Candidatus Hepatoplasma sp.]